MKNEDYEQQLEKHIKETDKKIAHYIWTILLSMITAIVTTLLLCRM